MQSNQPFANQLVTEGRMALRSGALDRAMALFAQAMSLAPSHVGPYLGRASVCMAARHFEEALYWFEGALARDSSGPALEGAGDALLALGRPAEALERFEKALALNARSNLACHGAAEALKQLGRLEEARGAVERAIELAPDVIGHHYLLAQLARFVPDDPRLEALERLAGKVDALPEPERCELHFALGKAYDDLGRHDEAFGQFATGNALRRRQVGYNETRSLGLLKALAGAFTPQTIAALEGKGNPSEVPLFVVGMPRSGTSLIEQILASHPQVHGAGETMYLHQLLGQGHLGTDFPESLPRLKPDALSRFGGHYVMRLKTGAPETARIVDKLPANFMLAGLIHLALPKARIIHVRRDPLDTCLSCYFNLFSQSIDYSYDLGELGRYYRAYDALMAHWHKVLPPDCILDVDYEAVVANLEVEARRIIAFTGLDWDPACLTFYRTKRVVHTLSAAQVREPIYARAVGRSAAYAKHLEPLRKALAGEA